MGAGPAGRTGPRTIPAAVWQTPPVRRTVLAAAAALLLVAGCSSSADPASFVPDQRITLTDGSAAVDAGRATAAGGEIRIEMGEFSFSPTVISAPADTPLRITLVNGGDNVHNFEIARQEIDVTVAEGGREVVEVHVPAAGAVTFECKFHLPRAMRGEIRAA